MTILGGKLPSLSANYCLTSEEGSGRRGNEHPTVTPQYPLPDYTVEGYDQLTRFRVSITFQFSTGSSNFADLSVTVTRVSPILFSVGLNLHQVKIPFDKL